MDRIEEIRSSRKLLLEHKYDPTEIKYGYNNRSLHINVGTRIVTEKPVTQFMKDKLTGGKGFCLHYLWNAVTEKTTWRDKENEIVISPGPLGGITQYPGAGKSIVCTISPLTGIPIDCNVGGFFGPYLKFAGFDALELQGISDEEIVLFIDGNSHTITIEAAPKDAVDAHVISEELTEYYAKDDDDKLNISVISSGRAAKSSNIGILNFSFWDKRKNCVRMKQAGRGGIGHVFRNMRIKAVVVRFRGTHGDLNNPYNKKLLNEAGLRVHREITYNDKTNGNMRETGTSHVTDVMNQYDLLPVMNFQYGCHPEMPKISHKIFKDVYTTQKTPDSCWFGCSMSCAKAASRFVPRSGPYAGQTVCVDGPEYETEGAIGSNVAVFDPAWLLEANFYCDTYGLDTISMGTMTAFAQECFDRGYLNFDDTEGLDLRWGNGAALQEIMHQMVAEDGFGMIIGRGVREMKRIFAERFGKVAPEYESMLKGTKWETIPSPNEKAVPTAVFTPEIMQCSYLKDIGYDDEKVLAELEGTRLYRPGANNPDPYVAHPARWEKIEGIPTISREEISDWPAGKPYYSEDPECTYTNGRPWVKMTEEQVAFMKDIGMELKGLEFAEYSSKESLAQQGGFGLANKGPHHDEAWVIFMDMVNNSIPTFEDKAEALWFFPLLRTWFGLHGLCKLPWNDIEPLDNFRHEKANIVPDHLRNLTQIVEGVTGVKLDEMGILTQSERVYTFQRCFNLRMGSGQRKDDMPPYRSIGPVTPEEYLSRQERYDTQVKEKLGMDPAEKTVEEKINLLRQYRTDQYNKLVDAVYIRRGWTPNGILKLEKLIELGMDIPELVRIVRPFLKKEGCWPDGAEYAKYEEM